MPRGSPSARKQLETLAAEREARTAREAELRKSLAADLEAIVVKAGGEKLSDEELAAIVKAAVKMGGAQALKKLV